VAGDEEAGLVFLYLENARDIGDCEGTWGAQKRCPKAMQEYLLHFDWMQFIFDQP
jgi:hypothetical protein